MRHSIRLLLATILAALLLTAALWSPAAAAPPTPPSETAARSELAALRVAPEGSSTGYSRDRFPHWITISGTCNTRETVLKRDGTGVVVGTNCAATSGSWFSPYDGLTLTLASDVDIDHMVPLAEAWRSGASAWTDAKRSQFANDLTHAQLWAVNDNVNSSKGDKSPDLWKPPRTAVWCVYARAWIDVKSVWTLTITSAEKTALSSMLNSC